MLWLSAALAAVGFALAATVRSETARAGTSVEAMKAYYLAAAAVKRATLDVLWSVTYPDRRRLPVGSTQVDYDFPTGVAHVELIPETAKLDVNGVPAPELYRLGVALGIDPARAQEIARAIDAWRRVTDDSGEFDAYYLSLTPSFQPPHASLQEIEELLQVKGVTPDIFYGTYVAAETADGGASLVRRGGLVDCLSVYGSRGQVDVNTADPAVLAAVGLSPFAINAVLERRRTAPLKRDELYEYMATLDAPADRLRVEGNSILLVRATARMRRPAGGLSDLRRTVAAQVKYMPIGSNPPVQVLRWYDTAWSQ